MSLFFFHVRDGSTTFDGDGVEFPDVEAARREAIVALASFYAKFRLRFGTAIACGCG
jgi:hypothetical protein